MEIDPLNYDVGELQKLLGGDRAVAPIEDRVEEHGFVWPSAPNSWTVGAEDPMPKQRDRLLELLECDDRSSLQSKPYLQSFPDAEAASRLAIDWLEFLAETAGFQGAIDALERYRTLGWFTPAVEQTLRDHMLGIARHDGEGYAVLDTADHLLSFAYVAKLAMLL